MIRRFGCVRSLACAAVMLLALAGNTRGELLFEALDEPVDAMSWYQGFHLATAQPFNNIGLALLPHTGDDGTSGFEAPAWDFATIDDNALGFSEAVTVPTLTWASGTVTSELFWRTHFLGDKEGQDFSLTLFLWDDALNYQAAGARWDGGTWNFFVPPTMSWEEFAELGGISAVMPSPSAAVLGLIGLGMVGGIRRKMQKK